MKFTLFSKLSELFQGNALITVVVSLVLVVGLFFLSRNIKWNIKSLTYGAVAIAASFVLSYFRLFKFNTGGSITIASMLPLIVYSWIFGYKKGIIAGLAYGLLQFIQDPIMVHWAQFLLDYPLAFAMMGLAGMTKKHLWQGVLLSTFGRYICHLLSGVIFFAEYAGDQNVWVYSLGYNVTYLGPDMLICLAVALVPAFVKALRGVKAKIAVN